MMDRELFFAGAAVAEARAAAGLTQYQAGELVGVPRTTWKNWESRGIDIVRARAIQHALVHAEHHRAAGIVQDRIRRWEADDDRAAG